MYIGMGMNGLPLQTEVTSSYCRKCSERRGKNEMEVPHAGCTKNDLSYSENCIKLI